MADTSQNLNVEDLMKYFDDKFDRLSRGTKPSTSNSAILKFKGNQMQYDFNSSLLERLLDLKHSIKRHDDAKSKTLCKSLILDVEKRMKCIKIADRSPAGWDTVAEYLSDDLASDSSDERKLRQAEKRALEKKKEQVLKRQKPPTQQSATSVRRDHSPPSKKKTGRQDRQRESTFQPSSSTTKWSRTQCFNCNRFGHLSSNCYARTRLPPSNEK